MRYGNLLDEDWQDKNRFKMQGDQRDNISLPQQVECYSIAGIAGKAKESVSSQLLGDKMVGVKSALGQHKNPAKDLNFKKKNTWIAYETSHSELLSNPLICSRIKKWIV